MRLDQAFVLSPFPVSLVSLNPRSPLQEPVEVLRAGTTLYMYHVILSYYSFHMLTIGKSMVINMVYRFVFGMLISFSLNISLSLTHI